MDKHTIFSATLGLSDPWQITAVLFSSREKRVDITVESNHAASIACPLCGTEGGTFNLVRETWHHHDFFTYAAFLHAHVPYIACACCGTVPAERPWSRSGSLFSRVE